MPNTSGEFPMPYPNSSAVPDVPGDLLLLAEAVTDAMENGYRFVQTVKFTSTGSFTKATYAWLRAIRVRAVGGGGAGGGTPATGSAQWAASGGGGSGGYAEAFITDISGLASSVTVTVGAGGTPASNATGGSGGSSSFGTAVVATGGEGGLASNLGTASSFALVRGGAAGAGSAGDLQLSGSQGEAGFGFSRFTTGHMPGAGGLSMFGGAGFAAPQAIGGAGSNGGGGGGTGRNESSSANSGGAGGAGLVLIDLFA